MKINKCYPVMLQRCKMIFKISVCTLTQKFLHSIQIWRWHYIGSSDFSKSTKCVLWNTSENFVVDTGPYMFERSEKFIFQNTLFPYFKNYVGILINLLLWMWGPAAPMSGHSFCIPHFPHSIEREVQLSNPAFPVWYLW